MDSVKSLIYILTLQNWKTRHKDFVLQFLVHEAIRVTAKSLDLCNVISHSEQLQSVVRTCD